MTNPFLFLTRTLLILSLGTFSLFSSAQDKLDVPKAYDIGVKAMDSGDYDGGLKAVDQIISDHGDGGLAQYGPVFGHFYYLKGMLHIRKDEYRKAIASFKICVEDYDNGDLSGGRDLPNVFINEALAQWGGCLLALNDYKGATVKYRTALTREEKFEPKLNRLEAQVNLSKAMILSGEDKQGKDFITQHMEDPEFPDNLKRSLFLILMGDWSPGASREEVKTYLDKYREFMESDTMVNRYRKQNPVYNSLASEAIQRKDPDRALMWYDMMISPIQVGQAYTGQINKLQSQVDAARAQPNSESFVKNTTERIAGLRSELNDQRRQLGEILMGKASAFYAKKELNQARETYLELARRFPKHPDMAVILHNLTMCAVNLAQWDEATKYGMQYFRDHPNHELRPSMAKVLVEVLFVSGRYQDARRVSIQLKDSLREGTPAADVPEFVASASLYHLNQFEQAEEAIKNYIETYPSGMRIEAAEYYLGATKVNLQKWDEAVTLLDAFLEKYKQSDLRPSALYFSGLSHLINEDYPIANSRIVELQARHPEAEEIPNSYNILGDILSAREKPYSEIVTSYQKALDMVENQNRGDDNVAGYSLRQLINEANAEEKWDVAVEYYDRFTSKYGDSNWRTDVLIAAIEPLVHQGRKDEAKLLLIQFVNEYADEPNAVELDTMFGSYARFLKQHYPIEEVRKSLQNFPASTDPPAPALQAWLYMAEIEALTEKDKKQYQSDIDSIFKKLNALYQESGTALSNYTLVQVARYNGMSGGNEAQARKVYEYILKERPSGEAAGIALVDLAKLEAKKSDPSSQGKARKLFERVLREVVDPAAREEATLGLARIEMDAANYEPAAARWKQYRSEPGWRRWRAEASYQYGVCLRELGQRDEAAATFVNVYSNFPSQLDWSTKAYIDAAKIIKSKGDELDALKLLREMIQRMGHLKHPGIDEGRKLFYAWRDEYVAKTKK